MACHRCAAFGEPVNIGAADLGTCSNGWGTYAELDLDCNNDGVETAGDAAALASGTAYSCGDVLWDIADFNRDGQVNTDDVTAFTAAQAGTSYVDTGNPGDYRFLYRGYWYDRHLGIYHVRHRAYDPRIQRWLQPDPAMFVDGLNRYAYCGNRPFSLYDPMGLWSIGKAIDGVINWLSGNGSASLTQSVQNTHNALNAERPLNAADASLDMGREYVRNSQHAAGTAGAMSRDAVFDTATGGGATGMMAGGVKIAAKIADAATDAAGAAAGAALRAGDDSSVASAYKALTKHLSGSGDQAGHLLHNAAFGRIIPHGDGLALPMKGNAFEAGTEHNKFHKVLDDFWQPYMKGDERPTIGEYLSAMEEALRAVGRYSEEAIKQAMDDVKKQLDEHGLMLEESVPDVPKRRTTKCDAPKERGS